MCRNATVSVCMTWHSGAVTPRCMFTASTPKDDTKSQIVMQHIRSFCCARYVQGLRQSCQNAPWPFSVAPVLQPPWLQSWQTRRNSASSGKRWPHDSPKYPMQESRRAVARAAQLPWQRKTAQPRQRQQQQRLLVAAEAAMLSCYPHALPLLCVFPTTARSDHAVTAAPPTQQHPLTRSDSQVPQTGLHAKNTRTSAIPLTV